MLRHFIAGHFWLFVALALFVGRTAERHSPEVDSFAGAGRLEPVTYHLVIFGCVAISATSFRIAGCRRSRVDKDLA